MPFHSWLPAAMVAPTPVSALLHAVAVVKVGVFSIFRVITGVFGVELLSSAASGHRGLLYGRLYSDCGLADRHCPGRSETAAGLFHHRTTVLHRAGGGLAVAQGHDRRHDPHRHARLWQNHLFFCAGAIFVATGKKYISEMTGIGKRMPVTMLRFFDRQP